MARKTHSFVRRDKGSLALDGTGEDDLFSLIYFCVFSPSSENREKQAFCTTKEGGRIAALIHEKKLGPM